MQLIQAKITGHPRIVTTNRGDRSVVDARATNGEDLTIWRPAGDLAVMNLAEGELVQLAIDSKGKVSMVDSHQAVVDPIKQNRSAEIADYIDRLNKLYGHCLTISQGYEPVALAFFHQSIKHFNL